MVWNLLIMVSWTGMLVFAMVFLGVMIQVYEQYRVNRADQIGIQLGNRLLQTFAEQYPYVAEAYTLVRTDHSIDPTDAAIRAERALPAWACVIDQLHHKDKQRLMIDETHPEMVFERMYPYYEEIFRECAKHYVSDQ